jgi:hypothetical protein
LMWVKGLSCSCKWGVLVSVHCGGRGRPPSTSRVADGHSVEELGFQLLDRTDLTLLQGRTAQSPGLLCTSREQVF